MKKDAVAQECLLIPIPSGVLSVDHLITLMESFHSADYANWGVMVMHSVGIVGLGYESEYAGCFLPLLDIVDYADEKSGRWNRAELFFVYEVSPSGGIEWNLSTMNGLVEDEEDGGSEHRSIQ